MLSGGLVQHSGSKELTVLQAGANEPKRVAGRLSFDDAGMGGPKVDVTFDATLVKEFTQAR